MDGSDSNDLWSKFNVEMSIFQSLDNEDPKNVKVPGMNVIYDIKNVGNCKKIDFSLTKNFSPPLTITFMWDGNQLYYNYFNHTSSTKKYAFNSWIFLAFDREEIRQTSYIRVLYKLADCKDLTNDEKKLLVLSIMFPMIGYLYDVEKKKVLNHEDNETISDLNVLLSLKELAGCMQKLSVFQNIHKQIKNEKLCTEEDFVKKMNSFFESKKQVDNVKENSCLNTCTTGLENCWNSIKSCFGGE